MLGEAVGVHSVAASQEDDRLSAGGEVVGTDRTICVKTVLAARM